MESDSDYLEEQTEIRRPNRNGGEKGMKTCQLKRKTFLNINKSV
jgi:hypothetical protein